MDFTGLEISLATILRSIALASWKTLMTGMHFDSSTIHDKMARKVHDDETRKIALVKAVHKQAATLNTPTTIFYSELEPIRRKFGVRVSRSSFDRQRHDSRSGRQFETDFIPATVTCTDIAAELPWELEQQAGSFVVRYPAQKSGNANPTPADDD